MDSAVRKSTLRAVWQGLALASSSRPIIVSGSPQRSSHTISVIRPHIVAFASSRSQANLVRACASLQGRSLLRLPLRPIQPLQAQWSRCMSVAAAKGGKGEFISIFQSGLSKPEMVEVNKERRTIRGHEHVIKAIHKTLVQNAPGIFISLDESGNNVLNWPPFADAAVAHHLASHSGTNLESSFVYQGAFAIGVRRTKLLSLCSLVLTTVGGPLLILGETAAGPAQLALAGAVVVFGISTTALLHMITSPYVLNLRKIADGSYEAETPLITGGIKTTRFTRHEVMPSAKPFTSFTAKGHGFFIHKELFIGDDAQLMLCDLLGDQAAEVMYESMLKKDPNDLDTLYNYGRFLWKIRGDYEAAEGAFKAILAEDPNDREVHNALQLMQKEKAAVSAPAT